MITIGLTVALAPLRGDLLGRVEGPLMAQVCTLESQVESVTVYREGARIERVGKLPKKSRLLKVGRLPLGLIDGSLQVKLRGAPDHIVPRDFKVDLQVAGEIEPTDLTEKLEAALLKKETLRIQTESIKRLLEALEKLQQAPRPKGGDGHPPPSSQLEGHLALLDFQQRQIEELSAQHRASQSELTEATEVLKQLQFQEQSQTREVRAEELRKCVTVQLSEALGKAEGELVLSYQMRAARWAPAYTVRFSEDFGQAELSMRAVVAQATDEDWSQVKLQLSTANPLEWRELPELKSQRVGRRESVGKSSNWRPPPLGTQELYKYYDLAKESARSNLVPEPAPPPPPPPAAAPAPPPAEMLLSQAAPCAAGGGGWLDAEADFDDKAVLGAAPMAASAPVGAARAGAVFSKLEQRVSRKKRKAGTGSLLKKAQSETVLTVDQKFMQYTSLRMRAADHPHRGELVWVEQTELYQESFQVTHAVLVQAIGRVGRRVSDLLGKSPPPGHHYPEPHGGFDFLYQAQGKVDVAPDGQFHSLPVFSSPLNPKLRYLAVPRADLNVFRSAEIENTTELAFPRGPADVLVGGDFLHTTPLRPVGPGGNLRLGLGVAQGVKLSRRATFKETTSGLMGGTASLPHSVSLEAINHTSKPITLEIQERLPEPASDHKDDIKVELGKVEPPWESFQPKDKPDLKTAYRWLLQLQPGQKRETKVSYTISLSGKYELVGGNRREPNS